MRLIFQKRAKGFYSRLICWWTGGEYFHVGMLFQQSVVIEANSEHGVTSFALEYLLDPDYWTIIDIPLTENQDQKVRAFLFREMGCKYDWFGLIMAQILGIARESKTKWFCSELAVSTLQQVGLLDCGKPCNYSPNKLYKWASTYRQHLT